MHLTITCDHATSVVKLDLPMSLPGLHNALRAAGWTHRAGTVPPCSCAVDGSAVVTALPEQPRGLAYRLRDAMFREAVAE